ncbi:hypothetical protein [Legionella waltersii]|uniref:Ankyrin repeat protein n=1 Tax=Legionella waltersii TaxID=66969 RepID=A0A0W1AKF7_9GAMM|nr:hypothetical protein [Legionella waltersii]KTD81766.1 Ankyrin repeat protein [Legionella waltersii]SNU97186.1 Ankyrin repeat protein [Legionella waltersii]
MNTENPRNQQEKKNESPVDVLTDCPSRKNIEPIRQEEVLNAIGNVSSTPREGRLKVVVLEKDAKGFTLLHYASFFPNELKTILELLPEEQRMTAIFYPSVNLIDDVIDRPQSLKAVLDVCSEEQKIAVLKTKSPHLQSILYRVAMNTEVLRVIQESLNESQHPFAVELNDRISSILNLKLAIDLMRQYGKSLEALKGATVVTLADGLEQQVNDFLQSIKTNPKEMKKRLEDFKREFIVLLNSKNKEMQHHRAIWKPIVANVLIALSGIGLFLLGCRLAKQVYSQQPMTVNNCLFFAKTSSEIKQQQVQKRLDAFITANVV